MSSVWQRPYHEPNHARPPHGILYLERQTNSCSNVECLLATQVNMPVISMSMRNMKIMELQTCMRALIRNNGLPRIAVRWELNILDCVSVV